MAHSEDVNRPDGTAVGDHPPVTERDLAALTESMTVLPDEGVARGAPGMFAVVSHTGSTYIVDERDGACECPDARYRDRECKHIKRVRYAIGRYAIPEWFDQERLASNFGRHVDPVTGGAQ